MAALGDHLEVIRRMLEPGRATFEGDYAHVRGAINEPKGVQRPRLPIIVGGNGRNVTFRYAARFAEELNLVFLDPAGVAEALPIVRQRCEEEGRDPTTLRVSLYARDVDVRPEGAERIDFLARLRDLGLARLVAFVGRWSVEPDAQRRFAEDCRAAGLPMTAPAEASTA
jgi:alkanesulfonate monooxygenase SsuD/methylene tetrahydromethanopterin reductase-like flavin-dependent oxidoreductase (luciferase family)